MRRARPSAALVIESGGVISNERSGRVIELGGPRTIEVRWRFLKNINMQQAFSGSSEVDAEKQSVPLIEGLVLCTSFLFVQRSGNAQAEMDKKLYETPLINLSCFRQVSIRLFNQSLYGMKLTFSTHHSASRGALK